MATAELTYDPPDPKVYGWRIHVFTSVLGMELGDAQAVAEAIDEDPLRYTIRDIYELVMLRGCPPDLVRGIVV